MPFPKPVRPQPTQAGTIVITLKDIPALAGNPASRTARFEVRLVDDNGFHLDTVQGDLDSHLTDNQRTALNNFMDAMRAKAAEAVP